MSREFAKKLMFSLAVTLMILANATQSASAAIDQCESGRMCFWHNSSYEGTFFSRTESDGDLGSNSDEAHSLYNRTGSNWIVYDDKNYSTSDRRFCVAVGSRASNLGASQFSFGDKISSVKRLPGACPAEIPRI